MNQRIHQGYTKGSAISASIVAPVIIGLMMVASSGLAIKLKPERRMADQMPAITLEQAIPNQFGDWHVDHSLIPVDPSPDVKSKLDAIYSQTLARAYSNSKGQRIMLSIAYGADQSGDGSQVHRPEFCYTAQGFQIVLNRIGNLFTPYGSLPVRRLVAVQGPRNEPITYWITVGDKATLPGFNRKIQQIAYGLTGKVPDGMLVRVSSIDNDVAQAYRLQDQFIDDMLQGMDPNNRWRVAGRFNQ